MTEQLEITDVAFGGKAVGRLSDGRVCFVRDALPGERVEVHLTRETSRFTEGELVRIAEASPRRVKAPCPYYGVCGGCSYQHVSYEYQVELKRSQVREVLRRLGGIVEPNVREAVPSPLPYGYRNRITVHRQGGRIGFHRRDGRGLVDIEACLIASDPANAALAQLRKEPVREGARTLREHDDRMGFHQTNDAVAALLLDAADAACASGDTLIDAYCGNGFFAHRLAPRFRRVIGIEWNPHSIARAQSVSGPNETYIEGDVAERLGEVLADCNSDDTTLILDPPAQGVDERVLDSLRVHRPARVLYISCDPSTLARDLKRLAAEYSLESATPFDMFPQTAEVEVLAILQRRA